MRYVGLTFVFLVFALVLLVGGLLLIVGGYTPNGSEGLRTLLQSISGPVVLFLILWGGVLFVLNAWLQIAFMRTVSRAVLGHPQIPLAQEFKQSQPFIWRIIGLCIVVMCIIMFPFVMSILGWVLTHTFGLFANVRILSLLFGLLGIYGIFHMIYFSNVLGFAWMSAAVDGHTIQGALKKSSDLVKGRWWAIWGRRLAAMLVMMMPYYMFLLMGNLRGGVGTFFALVAFAYYVLCFLPMILIPSVVIYHNAKE